jgi:hypothetical protein
MKVFRALLALIGTITFTGCANLGGGNDLLGTLSGLGQFADKLYLGYQAGVDAGHLPPSAEVSDKYAQYLFLFNLFSNVLKPSAPPPPELVKAKTELVKAIDDAKVDAAKAKKAAKP